MISDVYAIKHENVSYPIDNFNPSSIYPEYPFGDSEISDTKNEVYEMIRELFKLRGLDEDNYDTPSWNPLSEYVKPGMTVVLKPNWVDHANSNKSYHFTGNEMDCLITNTSVIRAVCDYCIIALKGKGKIIICDAPIQYCDIDILWKKAKIYELLNFYKEKGINVSIEDLRAEQCFHNLLGVKKDTKIIGSDDVLVKMDSNTAFKDLNECVYNVANYDYRLTKKYQHGDTHIYSVSKTVLNADVIFNLCKPKCHRYAGITAALKNCVGMVSHKETIPHRRFGSVEEGGDSYSKKSNVKKAIDKVLINQAKYESEGKIVLASISRLEYGVLYYLRKALKEDPSIKGVWNGNDTLWRTILDLNYIVRYTDISGKIHKHQQRKVINIGDMIVAGQHNGPLSPEPKPLGMVLFSEEAAAFDFTVAKVMGFNYWPMPLFKNIASGNSWMKYENAIVHSNIKEFNGLLDQIETSVDWHFIPHDGWKNLPIK